MRGDYRFLGVDASFEPDTSRWHNPSGVPKNRLLVSALKRPNPLKAAARTLLPRKARARLSSVLQERNLSEAPPLDPQARRQMVGLYQEDVLKLQDLIGRDLSNWLDGRVKP